MLKSKIFLSIRGPPSSSMGYMYDFSEDQSNTPIVTNPPIQGAETSKFN